MSTGSSASRAVHRAGLTPRAEAEGPQRVLDAAVSAFAERGFHATTTRDIAARAGLSPAALYVHYPSKAALLAHISLSGHVAALDLLDARIASAGGDPREGLRVSVDHFVRWHAERHRTARVVQNELAALPDEARAQVVALRRTIEARVTGLIEAGVAAGTMDVDEPRRVARAVLSLCVDVARWYVPGGRDTPESLGALYAGLALRMVGAHPEAGDA